ncbi:FAD-dependent thymidylate synthase [Ensifer sp. ENS10]|nr:FAD-dependent thymidylate synthase [Ensifer sp. ENS10]
MFAKVILASKAANSTALPLITMHLHYPDIIHGEVMTHRVFSRNARSMRAVPVATMVKEVREDPFVPWHWGKNQRGMQADEECNELIRLSSGESLDREEAWRMAANSAADWAERYADSHYHKQIANRIIAPYTWKHTMISSTSWANFLHLRDHEDAEPHFHDLAVLVREALANVQYQVLMQGQWHTPYVTQEDGSWAAIHEYLVRQGIKPSWEAGLEIGKKLSVARSARISYAPFDGDASIERELERYDLLVGSSPLHASPTEHQATPDSLSTYRTQVKTFEAGDLSQWETVKSGNEFNNPELAGNLGPGWIQFRKTLAGEYIKDIAA